MSLRSVAGGPRLQLAALAGASSKITLLRATTPMLRAETDVATRCRPNATRADLESTAEYLNDRFSMGSEREAERETALIDIGETLFGAHGYRAVSVKEVTDLAGLSSGSFYNYFPSKEAFYAQVLEHTERIAIQEAKRIIARMGSPINQLKALYRFITLGLRRSPLLRGVLADDSRYRFPGTASRQRNAALLNQIGELIDSILAAGVRRRLFRTGRFSDVRRLLIVIYTALLVDFGRAGNEALIEDVLTLLERGLTRRRPLRRAERRDRRLTLADIDDE